MSSDAQMWPLLLVFLSSEYGQTSTSWRFLTTVVRRFNSRTLDWCFACCRFSFQLDTSVLNPLDADLLHPIAYVGSHYNWYRR